MDCGATRFHFCDELHFQQIIKERREALEQEAMQIKYNSVHESRKMTHSHTSASECNSFITEVGETSRPREFVFFTFFKCKILQLLNI